MTTSIHLESPPYREQLKPRLQLKLTMQSHDRTELQKPSWVMRQQSACGSGQVRSLYTVCSCCDFSSKIFRYESQFQMQQIRPCHEQIPITNYILME